MTYSKDVWELNKDQLVGLTSQPARKYHNTKPEAAGLTFQRGREAVGVGGLILAEKHSQIFGLRLQVPFVLPGGNKYVADAVYLELQDGKLVPVVADFKGIRTPAYLVKKRAFKAHYGIEITEL